MGGGVGGFEGSTRRGAGVLGGCGNCCVQSGAEGVRGRTGLCIG